MVRQVNRLIKWWTTSATMAGSMSIDPSPSASSSSQLVWWCYPSCIPDVCPACNPTIHHDLGTWHAASLPISLRITLPICLTFRPQHAGLMARRYKSLISTHLAFPHFLSLFFTLAGRPLFPIVLFESRRIFVFVFTNSDELDFHFTRHTMWPHFMIRRGPRLYTGAPHQMSNFYFVLWSSSPSWAKFLLPL